MPFSCKKDNNIKENKICIYKYGFADTSLYIAFYLNGVYKKYYQLYPTLFSNADGYSLASNNSVTVIRNNCRFSFSRNKDLNKLSEMGLYEDVNLNFYKSRYMSGVLDSNTFKVTPNEIFTDSMQPTLSDGSGDVDKMILMNGYSLNIGEFYSTDNVLKEYENKPESMASFLSYTTFGFTKAQLGCNNFYLIEGLFVTKLGSYTGSNFKFLTSNLNGGSFRILRKF